MDGSGHREVSTLRVRCARFNFRRPRVRMQNGRLNLSTMRPAVSGSADALPGFGHRTEVSTQEAAELVRGNMQQTPLNQAFFSPANVQIVQNKIRREVYDRSQGEFLIDPQSVDELLIVMRAMYYQYGRNQPDQIPEQITELNRLVAEWAVPKILAECSMHRHYLRDITTMPVPLAHPIQMSMAGSKSQALTRFM
jgi:hypothetical protein